MTVLHREEPKHWDGEITVVVPRELWQRLRTALNVGSKLPDSITRWPLGSDFDSFTVGCGELLAALDRLDIATPAAPVTHAIPNQEERNQE